MALTLKQFAEAYAKLHNEDVRQTHYKVRAWQRNGHLATTKVTDGPLPYHVTETDPATFVPPKVGRKG